MSFIDHRRAAHYATRITTLSVGPDGTVWAGDDAGVVLRWRAPIDGPGVPSIEELDDFGFEAELHAVLALEDGTIVAGGTEGLAVLESNGGLRRRFDLPVVHAAAPAGPPGSSTSRAGRSSDGSPRASGAPASCPVRRAPSSRPWCRTRGDRG